MQITSQIIGRALGGGKHNSLQHISVAQEMVKQAILMCHVVSKVQTLFDIFVLRLLAGHINAYRIFQHAGCQTRDIVVNRCREQQGLALGGRLRHDCFQIVFETHIKHTVRFIKHQNFKAR